MKYRRLKDSQKVYRYYGSLNYYNKNYEDHLNVQNKNNINI